MTLLLLAAGGLATTHAQAADANLNPEGALLPFAAGDQFSWQIPGDQFALYITAYDHGADIDLSQARTNVPDPTIHMKPGEVTSAHFSYANGDVRSINILNGTGVLAVVRNELMANLPVGKAPEHVSVNITLSPNECRTYIYAENYEKDPVLLHGRGDGVVFAVLATNLSIEKTATGEINKTEDPTKTGFNFIQACNTSEASNPATIEGIYPAPAELSSQPAPRNVPGLAFTATLGGLLSLASILPVKGTTDLRKRGRR